MCWKYLLASLLVKFARLLVKFASLLGPYAQRNQREREDLSLLA